MNGFQVIKPLAELMVALVGALSRLKLSVCGGRSGR
jgi:hypothetical protein